MRINRKIFILKWVVGVFFVFGCTNPLATWAEVYQAKSASARVAPRVVTTPLFMRAMALPNAEARFNAREAKIRAHHLPGPFGEIAQAFRDVAPPAPRVAPSNVLAASGVTSPAIEFLRNEGLDDGATSNFTSEVDEPSVAVRGNEILYTGNWYAAFSTDGGTTFSYINPETTFPDIPGQPFCCDQVALYDPNHDLMIWFLQYVKDGNGNTARVAVAQGDDIRTRQWRVFDFTPQNVGGWDNEWFDYPDLAVGEKFLYVTTNTFNMSDRFTRSVILRLPLDKLAAYQPFTPDYFDTTDDFSLRPTQGAKDTMYFGNHVNERTMRVWTWPENSQSISSDDVTVERWTFGTSVGPGPDGKDWLGRVDPRITGGWESGDEIGFTWTATQDNNNYLFPHVRVVILNKDSKTVIAQPHIWNSDFAFAYPATAPNSIGVVGLSVEYGGGAQFFPSHAVGVLRKNNAGEFSWDLTTTINGTNGPSSNRWGDYLGIRPHGAQPLTWVASGFTLQGGTAPRDIEPRYVRFRMAADKTSDLAITKVASTGTVEVGDPLTYTLAVHNNGPNDATGVSVTDTLPSNVAFTSAQPSSCAETSGTVTCSLGNLAKDDSVTVNIVVTASVEGPAHNQASVSGNHRDDNSSNDTATTDTQITDDSTLPPKLPISPPQPPQPPPTSGHISRDGERNLFFFEVCQEGEFTILTEGQGNMDTHLYLYGPNNRSQEIENNDDFPPGLNSRISRTFIPGNYFVEVGHFGDRGTGTYTIRVLSETTCGTLPDTGLGEIKEKVENIRQKIDELLNRIEELQEGMPN
jgi:uncharacterized repeat protein (TIGR01451 family)